MSETYEFSVATPVRRPARRGAGRKPEVNPFTDAVRAIVGQQDAEGNPLARQATFTLDSAAGETYKQRHQRIRRFLSRAGKDIAKANGLDEKAYNIALVIEEGTTPGTYVAKFWDRATSATPAPEQNEQGNGAPAPVANPFTGN